MPTMQQIIDKINIRFPSGATNEQLVDMIDTYQKRLFRKYRIPTSETFDILADTYAYNIRIKPRLIFDILVNGESYPKRQVVGHSSSASRYYTFLDDFLIIYPTPKFDGTLTIYFYETPSTLTINELNRKPKLDEDFHDLLVYGPCKELAENLQRYEVATAFAMQYNELESELSEVFQIVPEVETILSESGW